MEKGNWVGLLVILTVWLASSCSADQEGEFRVEEFSLEGCDLDTPYVLPLDFVAFDACDDILFMRFQSHGRPLSESDGVSLQIENLQAIQQELKLGPVQRILPVDSVRLAPFLNRSCRGSYASMEAGIGTLTINALDPRDGGELAISAEFQLVDARTGDVVGSNATLTITGVFAVDVPHKLFSVCPE